MGRVVRLDGGPPPLSRDIRRNLRQGRQRLAADGLAAEITFHPGPAAVPRLRAEVTTAYVARCWLAARPLDLPGLARSWAQATEAGVLRIGGELAAWLLAAPGPQAYLVLAGQMAPGFGRYRPGRLLEAAVLDRAAAGWTLLDWGSDLHPEALITAP